MGRRAAALFAITMVAGCTVAPSAPRALRVASQPDADVEVEWPSSLVAGEIAGPSLHRGSGSRARGFAWIAPGTPVSVRGGVRNGRVRARVDGPLRVRGWIDVSGLDAVVLERGRIAGTPLYVVPGDVVHLVAAEGERADVEARATLGHPRLGRSPVFRGAFPLAQLGADLAGAGAGPTPGRAVLLRRAAPLATRPGAEPAWTIPALDPPLPAIVLREDGDALGVRIGTGPYLVGFVPRSAIEPDASPRKSPVIPEVLDPWAHEGGAPMEVEAGVADPWADEEEEGEDDAEREQAQPGELALTPMLQRAAVRPIWRVRAGTRVRVDGATVAIFDAPGVAVELERVGDRAEILAAVDETVTVRGTVPVLDLGPLRSAR